MGDASPPAKVALVTGANGITGSAIIKHLVKNTTDADFSAIIATSRTPLVFDVSDPRLTFIAIDFLKPASELIPTLKDSLSSVTHVYFSSYIHNNNFVALNASNEALFQNFIASVPQVAPNLQNIVLQTGGKHYGVHLSPVPAPCYEYYPRTLPFNVPNFYFDQEDRLKAASEASGRWSWNVIRPDAIIGAAPKPQGMNEAITLLVYILTCKKMGEEPLMPTNEFYWNGFEDGSDIRLIADLTVWASTSEKPEVKNQEFNINNGEVFTWRWMWPRLTKLLGVETSSDRKFEAGALKNLVNGVPCQEQTFAAWATEETKNAWVELCVEKGLSKQQAEDTWSGCCFQVMDWVYSRTWCNVLSMQKVRKVGWFGWMDSFDSFKETWEEMRDLGQVPDWR